MLKGNRGVIVLAKWPRPRPGRKSELQQAWIDRFALLARRLKSPDPITLMAAQYWTKGTGWYYRDILENAAYGKLIRYQGETRVITPTVSLARSSTEAVGTNVDFRMTPNVANWDNNAFWSPTINPGRMTFKSPGLYLINALAHWTDFNTHFRYNWLKVNGTTTLGFNASAAGANLDFWSPIQQLLYCHANDYIEFWAHSNSAGDHCQISYLQAVAITPEALIP